MRVVRSTLGALIALVMLGVSALAQCGDSVLTGSDTAPDDRFGSAVAVHGDTLIVGATPQIGPGQAYIFDRTPGLGWLEVTKLEPSQASSPNTADHFGRVDVEGTLAAVGAPAHNISEGVAYVYERSALGWEETFVLSNPAPTGNPQFGSSVAVDSDRIFIGRINGTPGSLHGVHVYERTGPTWSEVATLSPTEPTRHFGRSIAVQGDRALVGASEAGFGPGAAFVFERTGGQWVQTQRLVAGDGAFGDDFGFRVALDGDTALVGAFLAGPGSAYVFQRDPQSGVWSEQAELTASDAQIGDAFGISVALQDNTAHIGASSVSDLASNAGAVYKFERVGSVWTEVQRINPLILASTQAFGISLALDGPTLLVGAHFADNATVFGSDIGTSYCAVNANSTGAPALIGAVGECSVPANKLSLVATQLPPNKFGYFLLSQNQGFFPNPGSSQGNLCIAGPLGRFQAQVQNSGAAGAIAIPVDLTNVPIFGAILAGETWNFTCWYRDVGGASNFTGGIEIPFN